MPRTGRRRGATTSPDAILEAARRQFAETGYGLTSIRGIAAEAGVDASLIVHFFGSKEQLFRAAVTWPFDPAELTPRLLGPGVAGLGDRVARTFLTFWDDPETSPRLLALLRSAMTSERSARLVREFVVTQLFPHLSEVVQGPDRELRIELATGHLLGIAMLRRVLRVEPLASASVEQLVARVGPILDRYLDLSIEG
jgi:AcrR family transcriptional regulator